MATINFNIVRGAAPFEVTLSGSTLPSFNVESVGEHSIENVSNGIYTLIVLDDNGCSWKKDLIVNPNVTTTTTTTLPSNSIVLGNTNDQLTIFNTGATNRNNKYVGFPDNDIVELYFWLKTFDGNPLENNISFQYVIGVSGDTANSEFEFNFSSDEIHMEVQEETSGPTNTILGTIILKSGFIESFFKYTYYKGDVNSDFKISFESPNDVIYTNINTANDEAKTYGIVTLERNKIILKY